MRRIAIINQKGGVGKTTTTVNVGSALARMGHRVLLIDLDPQAHLTLHVGQDPTAGQAGVYEMLTESATVAKVRRKIGSNLWLCSASIDLAGAEVELVSIVGREVILRDLIDQHINSNRTPPYDYVLMDCPPSLNVLTLNALCAAAEVVIPLQPHYLALQGLSKLLETVAIVGKRINPALKVTGIVICMNEAGTKLAGEVVEDVKAFFENARGKDVPWRDTRVFQSVIRRNIKLAESPSYGKSIFDYAPDSNGAEDYQRLALELHLPQAVAGEPAIIEAPAKKPADAAPTIGPAGPVATEPPPASPLVAAEVEALPAAAAKSPDLEKQPPKARKSSTGPRTTAPARLNQIEQAGINPALAEPVGPEPLKAASHRKRTAAGSQQARPAAIESQSVIPTELRPATSPAAAAEAGTPSLKNKPVKKKSRARGPGASPKREIVTAAARPGKTPEKRVSDHSAAAQASPPEPPAQSPPPVPASSAQAV